MSRYLKIYWFHDLLEEPSIFLHEINADGWVQRAINLYSDGRLEAAEAENDPSGIIPDQPYSTDDIENEPYGETLLIESSEAVFLAAWKKASKPKV